MSNVYNPKDVPPKWHKSKWVYCSGSEKGKMMLIKKVSKYSSRLFTPFM